MILNCRINTEVERAVCLVCTKLFASHGLPLKSRRYANLQWSRELTLCLSAFTDTEKEVESFKGSTLPIGRLLKVKQSEFWTYRPLTDTETESVCYANRLLTDTETEWVSGQSATYWHWNRVGVRPIGYLLTLKQSGCYACRLLVDVMPIGYLLTLKQSGCYAYRLLNYTETELVS